MTQCNEGVTVVGRWPLQFVAVVPYVQEMLRRGVPVYFVVSKSVREKFAAIIEQGADSFALENLEKKYRLPRVLHSLCSKITEIAFFKQSQNRLRNTLCFVVVSRFFSNPLPTNKVVHVTKSNVPWLLCANGLRTYTMIGSWDHPAKFGATGYRSEIVFTWNEDLADDWKRFQGDQLFSRSFPFLFQYLLGRSGMNFPIHKNRQPQILFAFTFCSSSPSELFEEELSLASAFIQACASRDFRVLIKPKPNGKPGELDSLSRFTNVRFGVYHEGNAEENVLLTTEYNTDRLSELDASDFMLNVGTTFAFDAALYGLPIIQLHLVAPRLLPALTLAQEQFHIQKHFLDEQALTHKITDDVSLIKQFEAMILKWPQTEELAKEQGEKLRDWIMPKQSRSDNIKTVVDAILA